MSRAGARVSYAFVLLLGLALSVSCAEEKQEGPARGGTLKIVLSDSLELDPWSSPDPLSTPFLALLHEGLVRVDSSGQIQASHAKSWKISDDGLEYTFELEHDRRYEDGSPILARDYVRAIQRCFASRLPSPSRTRFWSLEGASSKKWRKNIQLGVAAPDSFTLQLRLASPDPDLLVKLALPRYAVPRAPEESSMKAGQAICSGPYRLQREGSGQFLFIRNPHYKGRLPAHVDTIVVRSGVSHRRAVQGIESGQIDLLWPVPLNYRQRLLRDPDLLHLESDLAPATIWVLVLNCAVLPTGRDAVREAVAASVNRESLVDQFGSGFTSWRYFSDRDSSDSPAAPDFDPADARQLLTLAKYPRGFRLPITVARGSHEEEIAEVLLRDIGVAGIHGEIKKVTRAQFWSSLTRRSGGIAWLISWQPSRIDPMQSLAESFANSSLDPTWGGNLAFYRRRGAGLDSLIFRGLRSEGRVRAQSLEKLESWLLSDLPIIPIGRAKQELFFLPRVKALEFHPLYGPDFGRLWLGSAT